MFSINFIDNTNNIWKDVRLVLESDVTNVVFEGERGGAHYNDDRGDIALDDVFVVEGNCSTDDCNNFISSSPFYSLQNCMRIFYTFYVLDNSGINEGTYLNKNTVDLPWSCDFGFSSDDSDWCGFKNDDLDEANFVENSGETPTIGTGPPDTESSQHGVLFNHLPSPPSSYIPLPRQWGTCLDYTF